jgi:hypothetical protein
MSDMLALAKLPSIKFHGNSFSSSRVDSCYRQKDRKAILLIFPQSCKRALKEKVNRENERTVEG